MQQAPKTANVRYFSSRPKSKRRRRSTPLQIVGLRLVDLAKLFRARYGIVLPNDDAGRDDITLAVDHLAALAHPVKAITRWLKLWAPWMTLGEIDQIVAQGVTRRRNWKADALAWRLRLTWQDRQALGITTIGAIDMPAAERRKRRRARAKQRKAQIRETIGAKSRATYERNSAEHKQPWKALGISRRTWFRRRGTGPATP